MLGEAVTVLGDIIVLPIFIFWLAACWCWFVVEVVEEHWRVMKHPPRRDDIDLYK